MTDSLMHLYCTQRPTTPAVIFATEAQEKDRLSANCRKGRQVFYWRFYPLNISVFLGGRKVRTSFTQQRKDRGLADLHCLLAKSEANTMAQAWNAEIRTSPALTQIIAVIGPVEYACNTLEKALNM